MTVAIVRIYDESEPTPGYRVLVDRVWPRGITRQRAALDEWLKDVAPSTELRRWFGHDDSRWEEFLQRYREELAQSPALDHLRELVAAHPRVVLLYGAKNVEHNQAVALGSLLTDSAP
ncbi:MAG TPA: DUF488 family protein [Terrimesophilobacter sp.]|nr:DUF488 family protein [Terrimesophilobacter sp.]HRP99658.1 DUF488 family protein [Terrimesophilobacter sp.]